MSIIIKKKTTPAKVTGCVAMKGEKKYTPEKKETGAKSYGSTGKPDSTSPERKAMNLAIVRARADNKSEGVAESGKYKGKSYAAGTPGEKPKLTSTLKIETPKANFEVIKKTPPSTPKKPTGKSGGLLHGQRKKKPMTEKQYHKGGAANQRKGGGYGFLGRIGAALKKR